MTLKAKFACAFRVSECQQSKLSSVAPSSVLLTLSYCAPYASGDINCLHGLTLLENVSFADCKEIEGESPLLLDTAVVGVRCQA